MVDTNVLVDVLENDPEWADWSIGQSRAQSKIHQLAINPIIYAELSLTFSKVETLHQTIEAIGLSVKGLTRPALFLAGKAFVQYRRQCGPSRTCLPIFSLARTPLYWYAPLLTRDAQRYQHYFPGVELITP